MKKTNKISIHNDITLSTKTNLSKLFLSISLASTCVFSAVPAHALSASSDMGTSFPGIGYGAQVLDIVLKNWHNPDPSATGTTSITLRLAKDGRPFSCETRAFSSSRMTDASFCETIAKIGTFPSYVGTQNPEITLTFRHDGLQQTNQQSPQNTLNNHSNQNTILPPSSHSVPPATTPLNTPIQSPDPYHTSQNSAYQQIPTLPPETAPSPTQAQLQQNHNLTQQPILSSDQVSILNNTSNNTPPLHMQNNPQNTNLTANYPTTPVYEPAQEEHNKNHEPQREITREEALAPPSNSLVLPEVAMQQYSQQIFTQARTRIRPPHNIDQGTYSTVARIDINGRGGLQKVSVQKSSGNKQFDDAVLAVLTNEVTYPPTPNHDQQSIWLTFTIKK